VGSALGGLVTGVPPIVLRRGRGDEVRRAPGPSLRSSMPWGALALAAQRAREGPRRSQVLPARSTVRSVTGETKRGVGSRRRLRAVGSLEKSKVGAGPARWSLARVRWNPYSTSSERPREATVQIGRPPGSPRYFGVGGVADKAGPVRIRPRWLQGHLRSRDRLDPRRRFASRSSPVTRNRRPGSAAPRWIRREVVWAALWAGDPGNGRCGGGLGGAFGASAYTTPFVEPNTISPWPTAGAPTKVPLEVKRNSLAPDEAFNTRTSCPVGTIKVPSA
jgi:hypothetical protein